MSGTARGVQRQWSFEPGKDNLLKQSAAVVLFEEHDKVVTDLETLRGVVQDGAVVGFNELRADHATFITVVTDLKSLLNELRNERLNQAFGNAGFVIVSNMDVKNGNALEYVNAGILKTLAADAVFDTGSSQVIEADKWSSALLSIDASGTGIVTWSATLDAANEAAAITALPAVPAGNTLLGYFTVLTNSGNTWTAGTDALATGTGGNVAATTNYFQVTNENAAQIAAAVSSSAPATLGASAASATAVNAAGDMTAATVATGG